MKRVLLYVGPVRMLEAWMTENLRLFGEKGNRGGNGANQAADVQKKSHLKGGRN